MTPPPAADEPEYLKVEEVAARLKLKEKTIRDWILRGELPAYKLGKEWRIRRDDFDQAMQARRTTPEPSTDRRALGSRRTQLAARGCLQPLKYVCILELSQEDLRSCVASHLPGRSLHRGSRGGHSAHDPRASGHRGIAHRVVELLEAPPRKLLTVAEVARLLAVEPDFVYAHQAELGVVRLPGKGRRPALRFDRDTLLERLDRSHATQAQLPARRARRAQRARDAVSLIELLPYEPRSAI
jgi:excisionase family DNA binding protein